jgi:hypothetical protein
MQNLQHTPSKSERCFWQMRLQHGMEFTQARLVCDGLGLSVEIVVTMKSASWLFGCQPLENLIYSSQLTYARCLGRFYVRIIRIP